MTKAATVTRDVVKTVDLSKRFGDQGFLALENVSLTIEEGQFVCVVGPSGCGKSTLLRILAGLDSATSGQAMIDGEVIEKPRPDKVGVVFQESLLLPWKTAVENVEFPLALAGAPEAERHARASKLIDLVGLKDFADNLPHQLSGGMRQRVSIARGLVREPRLLLMDEPFGALDEQTRTRMWAELLRIWEESRSTVLFITHSLVEAVYLADVVLVMGAKPGRIIERIDVDLPRPRNLDLLGSPRLGELRNRIWHLIADPTP
jgi:NitT/TauT family transport system ATP-binding protein